MDNYWIERKSMDSSYEIQIRSDIGDRTEQEDKAYVYIKKPVVCAVVCDGMGGRERGEEASRIAVGKMQQLLGEFSDYHKKENVVDFIMNAIIKLDISVSREFRKQKGGTTIVATIIIDGVAYWFSVGDSRLYILRNNEIVRATRDHNYYLLLDEKLKKGEITQVEYEREATRGEALISFLGNGGIQVYDLTKEPLVLMEDDMLLLATDGLYRVLQESVIQQILCKKNSLEEKADKLMEQVVAMKQTKKLDNVTFVLIRVKGEGV